MSRLPRKNAQPLGEAIQAFLKMNHLSTGFNTHLVYTAWDKASGASAYTIKKSFYDGTLTITLNSSVVRSQLQFQEQALLQKINSILEQDELFDSTDRFAGYVKRLVLK